MTEQAIIRNANESDLKNICSISKCAYEEISKHREKMIEPFDVSDAEIKSKYLEAINDEDSSIFVADVNHDVVGYIYSVIEKEPNDLITQPRAFICEFSVSKEHRGKGFGKRLLCKVEEWVKQKGLSVIHLTVLSASKDAIESYTKQGYKTIMLFMEKLVK